MSKSKVVVVEIGAGKGVPTVRREGESVAKKFAQSMLVRINPVDFEFPTSVPVGSGIPIPLGGLDALQKINAALEKIKA